MNRTVCFFYDYTHSSCCLSYLQVKKALSSRFVQSKRSMAATSAASSSPGVSASESNSDEEETVRSPSKTRTSYSCVQIIKVWISSYENTGWMRTVFLFSLIDLQENHRQQIYAVEVNNYVQYDNGILFATVGANSVSRAMMSMVIPLLFYASGRFKCINSIQTPIKRNSSMPISILMWVSNYLPRRRAFCCLCSWW